MSTSPGLNEAVFETFPEIRTERLWLRGFRKEDAQRIFDMRANGRVNAFISREPLAEPSTAEEIIETVQKGFADKQSLLWVGILREGQAMIGGCGFRRIEWENHSAELGGELDPRYWGKGIAQEAVQAVLRFGFEQFNLHRVDAWVWPENRAAIYLLEQFGFQKEAHFKERAYFRGRYQDMAIYSLLRGSNPIP